MLPSEYADKIGTDYSKNVSNDYKKEFGQFFTTIEIAHYMSSKIECKKREIKILDPGFGVGILSCAVAEHLAKNNEVERIEIVGYESDLNLLEFSKKVLDYLSKWLYDKQIELVYTLNNTDFILANAELFSLLEKDLYNADTGVYDLVISNPPYFKISGDDQRAKIAKQVVNGHPNMYSIFMFCSAALLKAGGEYIFIIPRSFASGNYFKAFRERFFRIIKLKWIHLFDSRRNNFHKEKVLQENIILKGIKEFNYSNSDNVLITSSKDYRNLSSSNEHTMNIDVILSTSKKDKILHVPVNKKEMEILDIFRRWNGSLHKYDLQISTGPVVSFRCREYLYSTKNLNGEKHAPLYDLFNVIAMETNHPVEKGDKPQYIQISDETMPLLVQNKNYIFLRRFSTKDDKKRLIASPYFMESVMNDFIGIENHLNYIYRPKGYMSRTEVLGLATLLNSDLFDNYFRMINGNINVSASELRNIALPPLEMIEQIGNNILLENNFKNSDVNSIVKSVLELEEEIEFEEKEN